MSDESQTTADLFAALAAIAARGDTLWAIAEDVIVPPDAGAEVISQAAEAFLSAMHKAEGVGPAKGGRISGERREAEAKAKCELIRERWALPNKQHPTKWLLAEVDVARATAIKHLGNRDEVQRKYAASLAAAERNRARRKRT